ncbi:MAG: hypothetical protein IJQ34_08335 [Kiritimatiellae bacterium]|nr:hypothetical protein [Kiritimatiellia bacterium]
MTQVLSTYKCATRVYAINAKDNQDDTNAINATNEGICALAKRSRARGRFAAQGKSSCSNLQALEI